MILKVDVDEGCNSENCIAGLQQILYYPEENSDTFTHSSFFYMDITNVKSAFNRMAMPYQSPACVVITFYDRSWMELYFSEDNIVKNTERFIESVFKMKMLGTRWSEEHPEKYV